MKDSVLIFFTIFVTTGLIYFLYKIMLSASEENKQEELQVTSREILEQLSILYKQKKYNIVENSAKKYLEKKGTDTGVRTILAKALFASGRIYEAIDQVKILIKLQPNNVDDQLFLANCYQKTDNKAKAISIYQKILEENPDNIIAIKELAKAYYDSNQKKSSLKIYQRLENFVDNNIEKLKIKSKIAEIYIEYTEYDSAIKEYEQILEIYPDDIGIKKKLIDLYKITSNYDSVIEMANQIAEFYIDEENGLWAMKILQEVYNAIYDYDKALEVAGRINQHPLSDKTENAIDIAKILMEKNEIDDSIIILKSLIEKDSKNIEYKRILSTAYEKKSDFMTAINIYKEILDDAPIKDIKQIHYEISTLYSNWAIYLFSQGDTDDCFKYFTLALQHDSQNPKIYYEIGNTNFIIKNYNEAIVNYKHAIEFDLENPAYYIAISECYEKIDSIYEQKKALSDSLIYDKNNPKVYYKLGIIYQGQNDTVSAISNFEKAVELNDNYIDAKHKLALLYEYTGKKEDAILLYNQILEIEPENQEIANNLKMINS